MYVGGLICQETVDWSHFGSSEVIQRFCPRSQRVVATVCLFVKSGVKWHLLTNRQTVTLSNLNDNLMMRRAGLSIIDATNK